MSPTLKQHLFMTQNSTLIQPGGKQAALYARWIHRGLLPRLQHPKRKKRKRILLSPPAAQNLQSAVHAERMTAVSVHAAASKAAVPCRRPNGRPKLHMCDLHCCLFNAYVRQLSYTRGHGRARAEHACVMLKTERRGGEDYSFRLHVCESLYE